MKKKYCIVTPTQKETLSDYEKISLKTIQKIFQNEDKFLVTFQENKLNLDNFKKIYFKKYYFESIDNYNKLCMSSEFYKQFSSYEYILICQLDVIVLSKKFLNNIFDRKISYIGALAGKKNLFDRKRKKLWGRRFYCNGGFSLRKIEDFLNVLNSQEIISPFNLTTLKGCLKIGLFKYYKLLYASSRENKKNKVNYFIKNFNLNEDTFWSYFAKVFNKKFILPSIKEANNFSFDGDPYFFYKKNYNNLPMALHGHHGYLEFLDKINYKF